MAGEVAQRIRRVTLSVSGVSCWGTDAALLERVLSGVPGVRSAYVNPATEMAYVVYDPALCEPQHLMEALSGAGFQAGELAQR